MILALAILLVVWMYSYMAYLLGWCFTAVIFATAVAAGLLLSAAHRYVDKRSASR